MTAQALPKPVGAPRAKLSAARVIRLVAAREVIARLRSRSFLVSTGILLAIVLGSIVVGGIASANAELPKVAIQRSVINALPDMSGYAQTLVSEVSEVEELVRAGEVDAGIVSNSEVSPLGITVIGLDSIPPGLLAQLSVAPDLRILEPAEQDPFLAYLVALGFGIVFFLSTITFGSTIAQSVVEEKQTRIVELLLATISARLLLAGKVVGNSILSFGQTLLIALFSSIGLLITGQNSVLVQVGPSAAWFVVFFVFGFVLLASMFAAAASLVSRQEDLGAVISPITTLVMLPYFAVIFFNDNPTVLAIMSYVPFSAPVGMPMRLFLGEALWWEPLVSLLVLAVTTGFVIVVGARIYSNALLRTGTRVKLGEALRG
ncbi:MAG: ABC transporter permease [Microbacteriaceae bacterium]|nr:ABC transporter permease [Microbacteriaceae bacterium]